MNKISKKTIIVLSQNFVSFTILLLFQNMRYDRILNMNWEGEVQAEVLRKAFLMTASGADVDWVVGLNLFFLMLNILLFKYWIKSNRWILIPLLTFMLTLLVTISYFVYRFQNIQILIETTS